MTRLLYRRLGLDACLLKVSLLRFLQYCLRVCAACITLAVESTNREFQQNREFQRSAHVTISYAIARCVANALIRGSTTIARYPMR